jgi:streptogramin lyase
VRKISLPDLMALSGSRRGIGAQGQIGRIKVNGQISEYQLSPCSGSCGRHPNCITAAPDRNLWFTDLGDGKVHKITTSRVLKNLDEHGSAFFLTDSLVRLGWYLF